MALTQSQIDALIQTDAQGSPINNVLSQLNLAIGGGALNNLVVNNLASAGANTTAIQAALTAGGTVKLQGQGVVYINATLVIGSNTQLTVPTGLTLRAAAGTGAMVITTPLTQAPTVLWNSSGSQTTGPQALIWQNGITAWTTATVYAVGAYTYANGGIYWCATGGTSGATAPTGTGSGISDGVCVWNYVTVYTASLTLMNAAGATLVTLNWPAHALSVGSVVLLSPRGDNIVTTYNYWSGTQAAGQLGGPCDSAYFGAFRVLKVNDANNVVIELHRSPAVQFSGIPMNATVGVSNIRIDGGGTIDSNYPTNTGVPPYNCHSVVLYGAMQANVNNLMLVNTAKFCLCMSGTADVLVDSVNTGAGTASDRFKIYGSANNITIRNSSGIGGDDILSIQTIEPSAFYTYILAVGDCINITASGISSEAGNGGLSLYAVHNLLLIDNIDISHINIHGENLVQVQIVFWGTSGTNVPIIGNVNLHDIEVPFGKLVRTWNYGTAGYGVLKNLNISNITYSTGNNDSTACVLSLETANLVINTANIVNTTGVTRVVAAGGGTVNTLNIHDSSFTVPTNGIFFQGISSIINTLNVVDNYIYFTAGGNGIYVYGGTVNTANIQGNTFTFGDSSAVVCNAYTGSIFKTINVTNNTFPSGTPIFVVSDRVGAAISIIGNNFQSLTRGLVDIFVAGSSVYVAGNYAPSLTYGAIRYEAAVTATLSSGGGNNFPAAWIVDNSGGSATTTVYGWDIHADVTKATRTTGSYCFNTNTAPGSGTLTTAGLVSCQGTSSLSWALLTNPSGQQY